jgi:hypothetical protein
VSSKGQRKSATDCTEFTENSFLATDFTDYTVRLRRILFHFSLTADFADFADFFINIYLIRVISAIRGFFYLFNPWFLFLMPKLVNLLTAAASFFIIANGDYLFVVVLTAFFILNT